MIYKFRLLSPEQENFFADIEVKATQSFLEFHTCIQQTFNYDEGHIASFFLCDENWEKEMEITLFDMNGDESHSNTTMDSIKIAQSIIDLHQKLLYVYDFFSERAFFIELIDRYNEDINGTYPKCIAIKGEIPQQIAFDEGGFDDIDLDIDFDEK